MKIKTKFDIHQQVLYKDEIHIVNSIKITKDRDGKKIKLYSLDSMYERIENVSESEINKFTDKLLHITDEGDIIVRRNIEEEN